MQKNGTRLFNRTIGSVLLCSLVVSVFFFSSCKKDPVGPEPIPNGLEFVQPKANQSFSADETITIIVKYSTEKTSSMGIMLRAGEYYKPLTQQGTSTSTVNGIIKTETFKWIPSKQESITLKNTEVILNAVDYQSSINNSKITIKIN